MKESQIIDKELRKLAEFDVDSLLPSIKTKSPESLKKFEDNLKIVENRIKAEIKSLNESIKNEQKPEENICRICLERKPEYAFPCGHLCLCEQCRKTYLSNLAASQEVSCPICRYIVNEPDQIRKIFY